MTPTVAIVGAGPYGLSIAAHLAALGVPYRIFGRPMDTWISHMPKGMLLKSDGFASSIYAPGNSFSISEFCRNRGIAYADKGVPVPREVFSSYGAAFRDRLVPNLEENQVTSIEKCREGFILRTDQGDSVVANSVVLAVGITHFAYTPPSLAALSSEFVSHSYDHADPGGLRGRHVTIVGGGSSAIDLAVELHEVGVDVRLVARVSELKFHDKAADESQRSLWKRLRSPNSGLGPGIKSRLYANSPNLFRHLPEKTRLDVVRKFLGPAGGWFAKERVVGKVPSILGFAPETTKIRDGKVELNLIALDGTRRTIATDHVIAATGYRVHVDRLTFLSPEIRSRLKLVQNAPLLGADFESSVPGLHFVGLAAANTFGPVMRFAFGAKYTAEHLSRALKRSLALRSRQSSVSVPQRIKHEESGAH